VLADHHACVVALPHDNRGVIRRQTILAHHLILTGYGHWLANDLRGSGSASLRDPRYAELGGIHHGRKPEHLQPSKPELRQHLQQGQALLNHPLVWFDAAMRDAIAQGFADLIVREGYTCWACAVLRNHAHLVMRVHRDRHDAMWRKLADESRLRLIELMHVPDSHPVWSERTYARFCYTPDGVRGRVGYVEKNPAKEGLGAQRWWFVAAY
jgi:hypothetical protein